MLQRRIRAVYIQTSTQKRVQSFQPTNYERRKIFSKRQRAQKRQRDRRRKNYTARKREHRLEDPGAKSNQRHSRRIHIQRGCGLRVRRDVPHLGVCCLFATRFKRHNAAIWLDDDRRAGALRRISICEDAQLDDAAQTPRRNHAPTRSAPHRRQRRLNSINRPKRLNRP